MFPQVSSKQVEQYDKYGMHNAVPVAEILSEFPGVFVSHRVVAGVTGATVTENAFICPVDLNITKATFIMDVVQTGTDNTPTVSLYNLTKRETIAVTGAIALSGTIGNKSTLVLDTTKVDCSAGDVLQVNIINPTATITVALEGKVQVEYTVAQVS